jgi:hypothetical protein
MAPSYRQILIEPTALRAIGNLSRQALRAVFLLALCGCYAGAKEYEVTNAGIFGRRVAYWIGNNRVLSPGFDNAGIYPVRDGKVEHLISRFPDRPAVSSDGCKVAVVINPLVGPGIPATLNIVGLCTGDRNMAISACSSSLINFPAV